MWLDSTLHTLLACSRSCTFCARRHSCGQQAAVSQDMGTTSGNLGDFDWQQLTLKVQLQERQAMQIDVPAHQRF